jgi:hypothetical protein
MSNLTDSATQKIEAKARWILDTITPDLARILLPGEHIGLVLAGGSLGSDKINDIDLYRLDGRPWDFAHPIQSVFASKNAKTFSGKWPIQFCNYSKPTLPELIQSFDFAHIQVGVRFMFTNHAHESARYSMWESYMTDDFWRARLEQESRYTGSEYPLSSLLRAGKYYNRGQMTRGIYIRSIIDAMHDVFKRGFKDYDDFKDQLDAVDLSLLPEEVNELSKGKLLSLYELLKR